MMHLEKYKYPFHHSLLTKLIIGTVFTLFFSSTLLAQSFFGASNNNQSNQGSTLPTPNPIMSPSSFISLVNTLSQQNLNNLNQQLPKLPTLPSLANIHSSSTIQNSFIPASTGSDFNINNSLPALQTPETNTPLQKQPSAEDTANINNNGITTNPTSTPSPNGWNIKY